MLWNMSTSHVSVHHHLGAVDAVGQPVAGGGVAVGEGAALIVGRSGQTVERVVGVGGGEGASGIELELRQRGGEEA